jgi:hypothetical protein
MFRFFVSIFFFFFQKKRKNSRADKVNPKLAAKSQHRIWHPTAKRHRTKKKEKKKKKKKKKKKSKSNKNKFSRSNPSTFKSKQKKNLQQRHLFSTFFYFFLSFAQNKSSSAWLVKILLITFCMLFADAAVV